MVGRGTKPKGSYITSEVVQTLNMDAYEEIYLLILDGNFCELIGPRKFWFPGKELHKLGN